MSRSFCKQSDVPELQTIYCGQNQLKTFVIMLWLPMNERFILRDSSPSAEEPKKAVMLSDDGYNKMQEGSVLIQEANQGMSRRI